MIGGKLTIDKRVPLLSKVPHEGHESDLGSVCDPKKHRFTEKTTPQRDAIESPHQGTIEPSFH